MSYSESGNSISIDSLPPNFVFWLYDEVKAIEFARKYKLKQSDEIKDEWLSLTLNWVDPIDDTPWQCPDAYHYEKSPILSTNWGQNEGYNNLCPNLGCSGNGHAPTGCVATAMAQVMKYYEYPSVYNWTNMPDNYGTFSTQVLMRDIGASVNMDYDCDGSSAYFSAVDDAFENDFSYSNATYADLNYNAIENNLQLNRPVLLAGDRIDGYFLGFPLYKGHAWVCDGYRASHICVFDDNGYTIGEYDFLFFHMNWGWGWNSYNSWCGINNFTAPNGYSYDDHKKMVYNIIP